MYIYSQGDAIFPYFVAVLRGGYDMRGIKRRFRRFTADYTYPVKSDDLRSEFFVPYLLSISAKVSFFIQIILFPAMMPYLSLPIGRPLTISAILSW